MLSVSEAWLGGSSIYCLVCVSSACQSEVSFLINLEVRSKMAFVCSLLFGLEVRSKTVSETSSSPPPSSSSPDMWQLQSCAQA